MDRNLAAAWHRADLSVSQALTLEMAPLNLGNSSSRLVDPDGADIVRCLVGC